MGQTQAAAKGKTAPHDSLGIARDDAGAMTALFAKLATPIHPPVKGKTAVHLLSEAAFLSALHLPGHLESLGKKLYQAFARLSPSATTHEGLTEEQFFKGVAGCTRDTLTHKFQLLFSMYLDEGEVKGTEVQELHREAFQRMFLDLALLTFWLREHPDLNASETQEEKNEKEKETDKEKEGVDIEQFEKEKEEKIGSEKHLDGTISALLAGLMSYESTSVSRSTSDGSTQTIDGFVEWTAENIPHLFKASIEILINTRFLPFSRKKHWKLPGVEHPRKSSDLLDEPRLWAMSLALDEEDYPVDRNLLYSRPTVLIIKDSKNNIFGAYTTSHWNDNLKYYGDSGSTLFSLFPKFAVYRVMGPESNYIFSNTHKSAYSDVPVGVGFGGSFGKFRLWIDGEFASGNARSIDSTYRKGPLLADYDFKIADVAVWGCGGEEALRGQAASRQKEANEIEKRRKVDKKMATEGWNTGADKWMMDMVGKTGHSDEFQKDLEAIKEGKNLEGEKN